jgi:tRNA A37 threonylcarbamoyladenosine synthetase subunit TsaC/SUA5/YrdC
MGNQVDLVIDGGDVFAAPSTILDLTKDKFEIIRLGDDPLGVADLL